MKRKNFTSADLKTVLSYDPITGVFTRRKPWGSKTIGDMPGSISSHGYRQIGVFKSTYAAHLLAWLYVYDEWPTKIIDHINRDKLDNAISNLRLSDYSANAHNTNLRKTNNSGIKGVCFNKNYVSKPWVAYIMLNGKRTHLGMFSSLDEAAEARRKAEQELILLT